MADGLGSRFSYKKIERRRPSKRQTTPRTFTIVRDWELKPAEPKSPIKEDSFEKPLEGSPVFPPPETFSGPEKEVPQSEDEQDIVNETNKVTAFQPVEEVKEHLDINESTSTSIVLDETSTPKTAAALPDQNEVLDPVLVKLPIVVPPGRKSPLQQNSTATAVSTHFDLQSPRVTRGRKRKHMRVFSEEVIQDKDDKDEASDDNFQYSENYFVRFFNADQGRKVSVSEITALDVALTAIEEVALEYREELDSDVTRQCIKEFFIHVRKSFGECIDMQKDYKTLKSDCRKVNSQIKKLRSELLNVQRKRARIRGEIEKLQKEKMGNERNSKDLFEISEYLNHMEKIHKSCKKINKESDLQDRSLSRNLPSLLIQTQELLNSVSKLKSINSSLEKLLGLH